MMQSTRGALRWITACQMRTINSILCTWRFSGGDGKASSKGEDPTARVLGAASGRAGGWAPLPELLFSRRRGLFKPHSPREGTQGPGSPPQPPCSPGGSPGRRSRDRHGTTSTLLRRTAAPDSAAGRVQRALGWRKRGGPTSTTETGG